MAIAEKARRVDEPFLRYFEFAEELIRTRTEKNESDDDDEFEVYEASAIS